MKTTLIAMITLFILCNFGINTVSAQFNLKIPKITNDKAKEKITNKTNEVKKDSVDAKLIYEQQRPTDVPLLLKNTIYIQAKTHDEYWKMKEQRNYSSWVPLIRFSQFFNNKKTLNYMVEYFNPDGSPWYSENLEQGNTASDSSVLFQSPSPHNGILDTKSTVGTGVYSFKITNRETKELLYQGKFKVGKFSRASHPQDKNKVDFFVEHDWLLPFGTIGFHYSGIDIGGIQPLVSVWLKGQLNAADLEGRLFYQDNQIASTKDGEGYNGVSDYNERTTEYAAAFAPNNIWKRWQFQWGKFRFDNNGRFNRADYPKAHYADKNPGDYAVKIYLNGTQIRELRFTVGADGRFVAPAYTNQIPLSHHALILPVKVLGTEKWDAADWKTNAFYGNPVNGFNIQ